MKADVTVHGETIVLDVADPTACKVSLQAHEALDLAKMLIGGTVEATEPATAHERATRAH